VFDSDLMPLTFISLFSTFATPVHKNHLAGDAVLYDARLLHFGLANKSQSTKRPLLYASFIRSWFQDKQNWGAESLR
jgi:ectoine hydroxylase-related dioxygenase (phytanoyl-CoA dioxygenase family)